MPSHSSQREKKILEQVQEHGSVSIKELARSLDVSAMTIHRDLNKLVAEGLVSKIHGEVTVRSRPEKGGGNTCAMCGKVASERTAFMISVTGGESKRACCAHCGLMLQAQTEGVLQSMTTDFLHAHMISATQAYFVVQSELSICCVPSVLSFGSKLEAVKFSKGFGGKVEDMLETINYLQHMMHTP
jgi:DeoR family transcriptional regulator, copper-sensing transcriptional repressor